MSERLVIEPFQKAVAAAVVASSRPSLPIKYLGRVFEPPNDQKYLEIVHIPNNPDNATWGSERQFRGVFRLILHWPVDDAGVYSPHDLIASICGYFAKDQVLWHGQNSVNVSQNPVSSGMLTNDKELLFVNTIEYTSFRT